MSEDIVVTKYKFNYDDEDFNIYLFLNDNMLSFYVERLTYANLYHVLSIETKNKPDDIYKFIENNLKDWIFLVMNETEED